MMNKAIEKEDSELFAKCDEIRLKKWKRLMRQEHDLIYFMGTTYEAVEGMVPIERDTFIEMTIERKNEREKAEEGSIAKSLSLIFGKGKK